MGREWIRATREITTYLALEIASPLFRAVQTALDFATRPQDQGQGGEGQEAKEQRWQIQRRNEGRQEQAFENTEQTNAQANSFQDANAVHDFLADVASGWATELVHRSNEAQVRRPAGEW